MTLKELPIGKSATLTVVGGEGALRQHFLDMGLIPGADVTMVKYAPMGDPVELRIHSYELTLRLADAEKIEITDVRDEIKIKNQIPYECQKLDENFKIVKEDYYKENGGVIFPNPNAPTGLYEDLADVEDIIAHNQDVIVIVDEAYVDFAGCSALELIDKYENLIIVQTFSKARSMAGMRIGYAISNPTLIKYLNDAKYSFNSYTMNQTSLVCGVEAVKDQAYFEACVNKIIETREWAKEELKNLGFHCLDSKSNFIFAMHPDYDAKELFEALKENDIYVRFWGSERIEQYMRITVGTREEMEAMFAFLKKYMNK